MVDSVAFSGRAHRGREIVLAVMACLSFCGATAAAAETSALEAGQQVITYSLEPAPLAQTLKEIARLGGRPVTVDESTVAGRTAGAVKGSLTASQAVTMALIGTGLTLAESADGKLQVVVELSRVVVVAQRDQAETSFKADRSDTATRSGTDLMDAPQAMTIITGKVLETQQSLSVTDALANVSGVIFSQSPQGTPGIAIRGFNQTSATVNGVSDSSARLTNIFGVERIEVLKGPAAILSGANSLGGGVNIVTKKPQADPIRSLSLQYGSNGDVTVAGDLSGAFNDDKRLTYRLIASESRARESPAGYDGRKDSYLLPELRWKDASTDLIVGASYGKQRAPQPQFTFARTDGSTRPAPAGLVGNPDDGFDTSGTSAFYQLEQKLVPSVALVSRFQRSLNDLSLHVWQPLAPPSGTNGATPVIGLRQDTAFATTSGDHYLRIERDTGPVGHKLSIGVNHSDYNYETRQWDGAGSFLIQSLYPATGPSSTFPDVRSALPDLSAVSRGRTEQLGVYAQDLMSWGDWNLLVNLRRSRYESEYSTLVLPSRYSVTPNPTIHSTNPGAGLVYKLTPEVSLYGNYAQGFVPQTATACASGLLPPTETTNKEAGVKFDLMGGKLGLTVDAFELYQSNALSYDSAKRCYNPRAAQVTKGVEADLQGRIAAGWSVMMNYAFTTAHDVVDKTAVVAGLSKHKMSVWTIYNVQAEGYKGLGFGLGVSAASKSPGSSSTTSAFKVPGQAQVDASVLYERAGWGLIFGIKNIADRRLYGVSTSPAYVPILPGRTFMLSVKHDFK